MSRKPGKTSITPTQAFGQAVRKHRQGAGLSQEELGFESELDRTYISGIERGLRNPTLKTIWRLAAALKVPPDALIKRAVEIEGE